MLEEKQLKSSLPVCLRHVLIRDCLGYTGDQNHMTNSKMTAKTTGGGAMEVSEPKFDKLAEDIQPKLTQEIKF